MATFVRKPLINDAVHSFCYACRSKKLGNIDWPSVIFDTKVPPIGDSYELSNQLMAPFATYALAQQPNYIIAMRVVILMAAWLRSFNQREQLYARYLLEKYYVLSLRQTSWHDYELNVRTDGGQELPTPSELSERNKLLDAQRTPCLPAPIPADKSESGEWW